MYYSINFYEDSRKTCLRTHKTESSADDAIECTMRDSLDYYKYGITFNCLEKAKQWLKEVGATINESNIVSF